MNQDTQDTNTTDRAEAFIARIVRIAQNTGCTHAEAAWAIAETEGGNFSQPFPVSVVLKAGQNVTYLTLS